MSHLTSYLCIICYAHDAVGVVGRSSDFSRTASTMSEAEENRNKQSEVLDRQLLINGSCAPVVISTAKISYPSLYLRRQPSPSPPPFISIYTQSDFAFNLPSGAGKHWFPGCPSRMPPIDPQSELQHLLPVSMALGTLALVTAVHGPASGLCLL